MTSVKNQRFVCLFVCLLSYCCCCVYVFIFFLVSVNHIKQCFFSVLFCFYEKLQFIRIRIEQLIFYEDDILRTISTLAKGATFILQEYFYIGQNYSEVKQLLTYDDGTDNQELFKALNDTSGSEVIWMVISYLCFLSSGGIC